MTYPFFSPAAVPVSILSCPCSHPLPFHKLSISWAFPKTKVWMTGTDVRHFHGPFNRIFKFLTCGHICCYNAVSIYISTGITTVNIGQVLPWIFSTVFLNQWSASSELIIVAESLSLGDLGIELPWEVICPAALVCWVESCGFTTSDKLLSLPLVHRCSLSPRCDQNAAQNLRTPSSVYSDKLQRRAGCSK